MGFKKDLLDRLDRLIELQLAEGGALGSPHASKVLREERQKAQEAAAKKILSRRSIHLWSDGKGNLTAAPPSDMDRRVVAHGVVAAFHSSPDAEYAWVDDQGYVVFSKEPPSKKQ